jgi:Rieske Fe-S protein
MPEVTRRAVISSGAAGVGLVALAACSSSGAPSESPDDPTVAAGAATSDSPSSGSGGSVAGTTLIKLADVPVGASASRRSKFDGHPCVVSQKTKGVVTAFSAICTHRGCTVRPAGAEFHCPCHGSKYDAFTGAVIQGPAQRPLPSIPVTVVGGNVTA